MLFYIFKKFFPKNFQEEELLFKFIKLKISFFTFLFSLFLSFILCNTAVNGFANNFFIEHYVFHLVIIGMGVYCFFYMRSCFKDSYQKCFDTLTKHDLFKYILFTKKEIDFLNTNYLLLKETFWGNYQRKLLQDQHMKLSLVEFEQLIQVQPSHPKTKINIL